MGNSINISAVTIASGSTGRGVVNINREPINLRFLALTKKVNRKLSTAQNVKRKNKDVKRSQFKN